MADITTAAEKPVNVQEVQTALAGVPPGGPTATIPETTFALGMAHATVPTVRTVESALREARARKPGLASFLVALASPAVLVAKGLQDLSHSVSTAKDGTITFNASAAGFALLAILIGAVAFGMIATQLMAARKPSELQELAGRHVDDLLREAGAELPPRSSRKPIGATSDTTLQTSGLLPGRALRDLVVSIVGDAVRSIDGVVAAHVSEAGSEFVVSGERVSGALARSVALAILTIQDVLRQKDSVPVEGRYVAETECPAGWVTAFKK